MNTRDKDKLNKATDLAVHAIYDIVNAYVRVLETLVDNEQKKYDRLPSSLHFSPTGRELDISICNLENNINEAEYILFSKVMEYSGKEDIFGR